MNEICIEVKPYWANLSMVWNQHQDTQKCLDFDLDEDGTKVKPYSSNLPMVANPHQDTQIYHRKPWRRDAKQRRDAVHRSYVFLHWSQCFFFGSYASLIVKTMLFSLTLMLLSIRPMRFRWFLCFSQSSHCFLLFPEHFTFKPMLFLLFPMLYVLKAMLFRWFLCFCTFKNNVFVYWFLCRLQ